MKIILVICTRPQFIKAEILIDALDKAGLNTIIVNTCQHYDERLANIFFKELNIRQPDYHLELGTKPAAMQIKSDIRQLCDIIDKEKPDKIVVIWGQQSCSYRCIVCITEGRLPCALRSRFEEW